MADVTVQALPAGIVNFGHCYGTVVGLDAGDALRVSIGPTRIYCRLAWDLEGRVTAPGRIALDSWQCAALGATDGSAAEVLGVDLASLPAAEFVELRLTRWSGPPANHSTGLPDFLRSRNYLIYPGMRFGYRPLGSDGIGEFEVTAVLVGDDTVPAAKAGDSLRHAVRRDRMNVDWPPTYDDIGGLEAVVALLRREVELPLRRPQELREIGINRPSGVLLYGPPGTGKTTLARAVAFHSGAQAAILSGPELAARAPAEAEAGIRAAFESAREGQANLIVIIDDIDYLTPARVMPGGPPAPLLGLIQIMLDRPDRPTVIATTSHRDQIDPAIRRLGRIGRQVLVPAPSESDRKAILAIHTRALPLAGDDRGRAELLTDLSRRTAGFVGADLEALCHEAGRLALRRAFPIEVLESSAPEAQVPLEIQQDDWNEALKLVTPSAIGGIVSDVPPTSFDDVAGLDDTVQTLREHLVLPQRRPEVFAAAGLRMERGVLLYGPPGTGKTLLARAIAHECQCRFMSVRGPELLTKWFGESEQAVREVFERARSVAPCVVFFDEMEAIARRRTGGAHDGGAADRVVNQLLAEIDGLVDLGQVSVIGATNDPRSLDPAILRPGRLGLHIEVPLPDAAGLRELFWMYLKAEGLRPYLDEYAEMTQGMSGAGIAMISREARLNALRRCHFEEAAPVTHEDVLAAIRSTDSSLPLARAQSWRYEE